MLAKPDAAKELRRPEELYRAPVSVRGPRHTLGTSGHAAGGAHDGTRQAAITGRETQKEQGGVDMDQQYFSDRSWAGDGEWGSLGEANYQRSSAVHHFVADLKSEVRDWTFATKFMVGCAVVAGFILVV